MVISRIVQHPNEGRKQDLRAKHFASRYSLGNQNYQNLDRILFHLSIEETSQELSKRREAVRVSRLQLHLKAVEVMYGVVDSAVDVHPIAIIWTTDRLQIHIWSAC